jgi:hypothetical protein
MSRRTRDRETRIGYIAYVHVGSQSNHIRDLGHWRPPNTPKLSIQGHNGQSAIWINFAAFADRGARIRSVLRYGLRERPASESSSSDSESEETPASSISTLQRHIEILKSQYYVQAVRRTCYRRGRYLATESYTLMGPISASSR